MNRINKRTNKSSFAQRRETVYVCIKAETAGSATLSHWCMFSEGRNLILFVPVSPQYLTNCLQHTGCLLDGWMDGRVEGWVGGVWMDGGMDGGWMDRCVDRGMERRMEGWTDRKMDERTNQRTHLPSPQVSFSIFLGVASRGHEYSQK